GNFRDRRYLRLEELGWKGRAWHRSRREANGALRRRRDPGAGRRRPTAAAVPLSTSGQPGDDRAQQGGGGFRLDETLGPVGLAPLGLCPYLLPDRFPLAHCRRARLAVGLYHLPPRCADHPRRDRRHDDGAPAGTAAALTASAIDVMARKSDNLVLL